MIVRPYRGGDRLEWARMRRALWPDQTDADMASWLGRADAVTLVAERERAGLCGFVEVGARPFADGCRSSPVAYVEGWWVDDDVRRQGVGSALIRAAEEWARDEGYTEIASDAALHNLVSHHAHESLGFMEVERAVLYRKDL